MTEVRFGLIGYGAWGAHHAAAITQTPGARLEAIAAKSDASQQAAREAHPDAAVCGNFHQLLRNANVDVVDIVVPSYLHHETASAALDAGKDVLLEKPMAMTVEECRDLAARAQQHGRLLAVGHELRQSSLWGTVKEYIDRGFVGLPQYVLVELSRRPYREGSGKWRFDIERVGNWILEEPIHFFDLARWYLASAGEPESVYAAANSRDASRPQLQDNFSAIMKYAGGEFAVISQTLSAFEHHQTVKVAGTSGAMWASWSGAMDRTLHPTFSLRAFDGAQTIDVPIEKITGEVFELQDQIALVVRAVRERGFSKLPGAEDGTRSVAMCLAAAKSVKSGRAVNMSEVLKP
jgi:myo-inositol 2-dehydrogenase/D-chiro-inositol 1-dehydrogenase